MANGVQTNAIQKTDDQKDLMPCPQCNGKGRWSDELPKSKWPALDWLSCDGEICNTCGGSGKIPSRET